MGAHPAPESARMAAISNPEAVRFVNEVVRPLCEAARDLKVKIDAAAARCCVRQLPGG